MNKPSVVAADELRQSVVYLANNSGLPPFVIAMLLTDLANEAQDLAKKELEQGNAEWNEYCKKQSEEGEDVH